MRSSTPVHRVSLGLFLILAYSGLLAANTWSDARSPASGPPESIGETSAGCIKGAKPLATEGDGYEVMHLERKRYFGHPLLIQAIQTLGSAVSGRLGLMHVGDLGMARGGPMPFGHRSHQNGLDADIWFDLSTDPIVAPDSLRSNIFAPSFLITGTNQLDRALWSEDQAELLKTAAALPSVDRIFVNARIKKELCNTVSGSRTWLQKIRPWYFHDDHFHMRLSCPDNSPNCVRQAPIPEGEGCDSSLDEWLMKAPLKPSVKPPPPPNPSLPFECREVRSNEASLPVRR